MHVSTFRLYKVKDTSWCVLQEQLEIKIDSQARKTFHCPPHPIPRTMLSMTMVPQMFADLNVAKARKMCLFSIDRNLVFTIRFSFTDVLKRIHCI